MRGLLKMRTTMSGSTHLLTRRLANVSTEVSLQVLAYNFKRVLSILGISREMKAMKFAGA